MGGSGTEFLDGASVAVAGFAGLPILAAANGGGANISYTLGSDDFVELDATAVITLAISDS